MTMIAFDEILQDLELKRATALPAADRPPVDVTGALAGVDTAPEVALLEDDGGERALALTDIGRLVGDAVSAVALAHGESVADTAAGRATVRAATARVVQRLAADGATRLTVADLSALTEAALIDAGQFELAKALVLTRTVAGTSAGSGPARDAAGAAGLRLIRRSGEVVSWNPLKIEVAIRKAFLSLGADPEPATRVAERIDERAASLGGAYIPIETVQDLVQEELVLGGHVRVAERYVVYRAERAILRAQQAVPASSPPPAIPVIEADGTEIVWTGEDLRARIAFASIGLEDLATDRDELERELRRSVRPGVGRADLQRLVLLNAKSLVERDAEFSRFAGRLLLTYIYEETLGWDVVRDGVGGLRDAHRRGLRQLLQRGIAIKRIDERLRGYDLTALADALDPTADLDFDFLGLQTLYDRYLLVDKTASRPVRIEAPQLFWMRVAMGICLAEPENEELAAGRPTREQRVLDLYRMYKSRRFCSSTPTLFNAGTPHSQLSSCYLYKVEDTLSSIVGRGIAENAMCSKWGRRTGRLVDGGARHRLVHRVDQWREPGRRPVPQAAQRPAGRRQPGRQAGRLGLCLPRGVAQRHPRVPRAAPRHRGRAPAHARHEHRLLDPGSVHEARRGARGLDSVPVP